MGRHAAPRPAARVPVGFAAVALACLAGTGVAAECAADGDDGCTVEEAALLQVKQVPVGPSPAVPDYCGGTGGPGAEFQSPINIDSKAKYQAVGSQPTFYAKGGGCPAVYFAANGKEWKGKFVSGTHPVNCSNLRMSFQGTVYTMVQFMLREGAEDSVDGKELPMQLTMVHISEDAKYAAVSVLIKSQDWVANMNPFFGNIFQASSKIHPFLTDIFLPDNLGSESVSTGLYNPYQILTKGGKFWSYQGSSTQSPCLPGITWLLAQDPVAVASDDIEKYKSYLQEVGQGGGDNSRPVQPLNGRTIKVGTFGPTITDDSKIPPFGKWPEWRYLVRAIEF